MEGFGGEGRGWVISSKYTRWLQFAIRIFRLGPLFLPVFFSLDSFLLRPSEYRSILDIASEKSARFVRVCYYVN